MVITYFNRSILTNFPTTFLIIDFWFQAYLLRIIADIVFSLNNGIHKLFTMGLNTRFFAIVHFISVLCEHFILHFGLHSTILESQHFPILLFGISRCDTDLSILLYFISAFEPLLNFDIIFTNIVFVGQGIARICHLPQGFPLGVDGIGI